MKIVMEMNVDLEGPSYFGYSKHSERGGVYLQVGPLCKTHFHFRTVVWQSSKCSRLNEQKLLPE